MKRRCSIGLFKEVLGRGTGKKEAVRGKKGGAQEGDEKKKKGKMQRKDVKGFVGVVN